MFSWYTQIYDLPHLLDSLHDFYPLVYVIVLKISFH